MTMMIIMTIMQEVNAQHQGRRQKLRRVVQVSVDLISDIRLRLFDFVEIGFDYCTLSGLGIQGLTTTVIVAVADNQV